jgi:hypothetical protein
VDAVACYTYHICNVIEDHTLVVSIPYTFMITKNQSLTIASRLRNLRICTKYAKCDENNVFYSLPVVTKIQEKKTGTNHITIAKKLLNTVNTIAFWVIRLQRGTPAHEEMDAAIERYERKCPTFC